MRKLILAALLAGTTAAHAQATYFTGQDLYNRFQGTNIERSIALGYVAGVNDTHSGTAICIPPNIVTLGQLGDMVEQALRRAPSERHMSADVYVLVTLADRWPCPKKKGGSL